MTGNSRLGVVTVFNYDNTMFLLLKLQFILYRDYKIYEIQFIKYVIN